MKNKLHLVLYGLACVAVGVFIGWLLDIRHIGEDDDPSNFSELRESGHLLINPLLECDSAKASIRKRALRPFEEAVAAYVNRTRKQLGIDSISLYFRELNDGLWFSIGDLEHFRPVSLLKMPLMLAVYKEEERSPGFLKLRIRYQEKTDLNTVQSIKPTQVLHQGESYSIGELVKRMIAYSDNNAFNVLEGIVDPKIYQDVYSQLGIEMSTLEHPDRTVSAKQYATFFRVLYNASLLGREMSEKALDMLTTADFKEGLVAGVPPSILVAHKFGEGGQDGFAELHDCGIVYYPRHPYLLCILSRGKDQESLKAGIQLISSSVFTNVEGQHESLHNPKVP